MSALEALTTPLAGRYRLERELGRGGMAMLRRAGGESRPTIVHNWTKELNDKLAARKK